MARSLRVEADGGSRGNPGVAGYGALVKDAAGSVLAERAAPLGRASNNVAEYTGLIVGLRAAAAIDPGADVTVSMDSKLVVEQMSGRWKIKHEDMRRLALEAREVANAIVAEGGSVTYRWIPRERNADADKLSNVGMDGHTVCRGAAPDPTSAGDNAADDAEAAGDAAGVSGDGERAGADGDRAGAGAAEGDAEAAGSVDAATETAPPVAASRGRGEPTRIVLVRHGVTEFTEQMRLDGRGGPDPALSSAGREQAERAAYLVGELLAGGPVRITTSTLARAVETGAVVSAALGVEPVRDADWDEQNFGDWDGVSMPDLIRDVPGEVAALRSDPAYRRPGGESHAELTQRVGSAFIALVEGGGTHVVVCHRKPILVVLSAILGLGMEVAWRLAAAPGSLTGIEAWPDGAATIVFTNRT